ncbi:MAG: hypothetical protein KGM47_09685 [Acidobacteriota bacterium]|nr:hypothetical protein [Acidobacteriota bacterium]
MKKQKKSNLRSFHARDSTPADPLKQIEHIWAELILGVGDIVSRVADARLCQPWVATTLLFMSLSRAQPS